MKDFLFFKTEKEKTRYDRYLKRKSEKNQIYIISLTSMYILFDSLIEIILKVNNSYYKNAIENVVIIEIVVMIVVTILWLLVYCLKKTILKRCKKKKVIYLDTLMFTVKMLFIITYIEPQFQQSTFLMKKEFTREIMFAYIMMGIKVCLIEATFLINYFRWITKIISIISSCFYIGVRILETVNLESLMLLAYMILLILIVIKMEKQARKFFLDNEAQGAFMANNKHFKYIFENSDQKIIENFFNQSSEGLLFIDSEWKEFHHNSKIHDFFYSEGQQASHLLENITNSSPKNAQDSNEKPLKNLSDSKNIMNYSVFKTKLKNNETGGKRLKEKEKEQIYDNKNTVDSFLNGKITCLKDGPDFLNKFFQEKNIQIMKTQTSQKKNCFQEEDSIPSRDDLENKYINATTLKDLCVYYAKKFNKEKETNPKKRLGSLKTLNLIYKAAIGDNSDNEDYKVRVEINILYYNESKEKFKEKVFEVMIFPIMKEKIITHFIFLVQDLFLETAIRHLTLENENKSKTLAFVAHEMRTPLNCIKGMLQVLKDKMSGEILLKFVMPAITSSEFLLNLLNDLLDISTIQNGKFKLISHEFDLKTLLEDVLSLFIIMAKSKDIKIFFTYEPKNEFIRSDPNRIRQIVTNLMGNAMKFTKQGSISLSVSVNSQDTRLFTVKVTDTGVGIKPEGQTKLFQAFGKVDSNENEYLNSQGVGLGLLISNILAKNLGPPLEKLKMLKLNPGLNLQSNYGEGTTFKFVIEDKNETDVMSCHSNWNVNNPSPCTVRMIEDLNLNKADQEESISKCDSNQCWEEEEKKQSHTQTHIKERSSFASLFPLQKHKSRSFVHLTTASGDKEQQKQSPIMAERNLFEKKFQTNTKTIVLNDLSPEKNGMKILNLETENAIKTVLNNCDKKCPKILICDDDFFNLMVLENFLLEYQTTIEKAYNGVEALEKVKYLYTTSECCRVFQVIFLDIEMPEKNGHDACKEIISFYKEKGMISPLIIATTGHTEDKEMKKLEKSGFDANLSKPISKKEMKKILKKFLVREKSSNTDNN